MTTVAFVPVRGGSRGIPGKNLRPFCGQPLVSWCLRALQGASRVDCVVVSTDCDDTEAAVTGLGLDKVCVYRRGAATATDTATTETAILEYLGAVQHAADDVFVLVQATSPFTTAADVDDALERFAGGEADSMVSCVRTRRFFWTESGQPQNYDPQSRPRRQDFDGCLMENGAFYVSTVGRVLAAKNRISGVVEPFVMPDHTAVELDEADDWVVGEALMRRHGPAPLARARDIRMVLTDVDGVLTDGGMYYGECGDELKRFNTLDGLAFALVREHGREVGIVTAENTALVARRARKLQVEHLHQGVRDKLALVGEMVAQEGLTLDQVCYVGDDLGDLELMKAVGLAACPASATDAVREVAHFVCTRRGGEGCVREVVDQLLLPAWRNASLRPDSEQGGRGGDVVAGAPVTLGR